MTKSKIAIIVSAFYPSISDNLLFGCLRGLEENGYHKKNITIIKVPGAFEIPLTAGQLAYSGNYKCIICLGCIIKGDTKHFDLVSNECAHGIMHVQLSTGIPIIFEVLAVNHTNDAIKRSNLKNLKKNKGYSAANCAVTMIEVIQAVSRKI